MLNILIYLGIGLLVIAICLLGFSSVGKRERKDDPRIAQEEMVMNCGDESLIQLYKNAVSDEDRAEIAGFAAAAMASAGTQSKIDDEEDSFADTVEEVEESPVGDAFATMRHDIPEDFSRAMWSVESQNEEPAPIAESVLDFAEPAEDAAEQNAEPIPVPAVLDYASAPMEDFSVEEETPMVEMTHTEPEMKEDTYEEVAAPIEEVVEQAEEAVEQAEAVEEVVTEAETAEHVEEVAAAEEAAEPVGEVAASIEEAAPVAEAAYQAAAVEPAEKLMTVWDEQDASELTQSTVFGNTVSVLDTGNTVYQYDALNEGGSLKGIDLARQAAAVPVAAAVVADVAADAAETASEEENEYAQLISCKYCGTPLESGDNFCMICGMPVNDMDKAADDVPAEPAAEVAEQLAEEIPQQAEPALEAQVEAADDEAAYTAEIDKIAAEIASLRQSLNFWDLDMSKEAAAEHKKAAQMTAAATVVVEDAAAEAVVAEAAAEIPAAAEAEVATAEVLPAAEELFPAEVEEETAAEKDEAAAEDVLLASANVEEAEDIAVKDQPVAAASVADKRTELWPELSGKSAQSIRDEADDILLSVQELEKRLMEELGLDSSGHFTK